MGTPLLGQALRVAAAWLGLATATTCTLLDRLADRIDPPGLEGQYAGFDTRLCDLSPVEKARVMLADPDGYYRQVRAEQTVEVKRERQANAREGRV